MMALQDACDLLEPFLSDLIGLLVLGINDVEFEASSIADLSPVERLTLFHVRLKAGCHRCHAHHCGFRTERRIRRGGRHAAGKRCNSHCPRSSWSSVLLELIGAHGSAGSGIATANDQRGCKGLGDAATRRHETGSSLPSS